MNTKTPYQQPTVSAGMVSHKLIKSYRFIGGVKISCKGGGGGGKNYFFIFLGGNYQNFPIK